MSSVVSESGLGNAKVESHHSLIFRYSFKPAIMSLTSTGFMRPSKSGGQIVRLRRLREPWQSNHRFCRSTVVAAGASTKACWS